MVETDNAHSKRGSFNKNHSGYSLQFLMTEERIQVLDLLKHLITHFNDSIVCCGPKGVGKTRLLKILEHEGIAYCQLIWQSATEEATSETLLERVSPVAERNRSGSRDRLFNKGSTEAARDLNIKTVLVIDDAGFLAPGLCDELIRYADQKPYLIIIFVLNHDQLQLKHQSDPSIDDCNVVEIPAFSKKQCGEFINHLSTQTRDAVTVDPQSETAISDVFKHTHGIPARILEKYVVTPKKNEDNPTSILITAGALLVFVALAVQWYSSTQKVNDTEIPKMVSIKKSSKSTDFEVTQPILSLPIVETGIASEPGQTMAKHDNSLDQVNRRTTDKTKEIQFKSNQESLSESDLPASSQRGSQDIDNARTLSKGAEAIGSENNSKIEPALITQLPNQEASSWLESQDEQIYTLQLMVLSRQESIFEVINKYPALRNQMKYIKRRIRNKEKYVLLYGTFADASQALLAKQQLPEEFRKSMARKIAAINKEFP